MRKKTRSTSILAISSLLLALAVGLPQKVSAHGSRTPTPTSTPTSTSTPTPTSQATATPTPTPTATSAPPTPTPTSSGGPPAPPLVSPADGAQVTVPFGISWSAVSDPNGIVAYNWEISPSSTFSPIVDQNSLSSPTTKDTVSGLPNGTYYWRVDAVAGPLSNEVTGAWSATRSFTVTGANSGELGPPTLNPLQFGNAYHPYETFPVTWTAVPGAAHYEFELGLDPNFTPQLTSDNDQLTTTSTTVNFGNPITLYLRVRALNASGAESVPSNEITVTITYNAPLPPPPNLLSPINGTTVTLPVTFTWTNVPNPQINGYNLEIADDPNFTNIEVIYSQITGPSNTQTSLTSGTKYWRVNSTQGDASPTTGAVTAWSATGTFVVPSTPPKFGSLAVAYDPASNGEVQTVTVQLTTPAPAGGAVINLTSSNPSAAPVPATFTMPAGFAWNQFRFTIGSVSSSTPVTLTASVNGSSATVSFTVLPVALQNLTVYSPITGGVATSLIVMLNGAAPTGGEVVSLSSSSSAASPPKTATVAAGDQSVTVDVPTSAVTSTTTVTLSATLNGKTVQTQLTLTPQAPPASLSISPNPVSQASSGSFGTVTIASPLSADLTLPLTNSNPSAATIPNAVTIPAGSTTGGFNITTPFTSTTTTTTISVSGAGVTKSVTLTVNPPPP
jgi:hypothetical protein